MRARGTVDMVAPISPGQRAKRRVVLITQEQDAWLRENKIDLCKAVRGYIDMMICVQRLPVANTAPTEKTEVLIAPTEP